MQLLFPRKDDRFGHSESQGRCHSRIKIKHFKLMVHGTVTFSIMTFSIMTISIMTFSVMTFSIMTFSIMTFSV